MSDNNSYGGVNTTVRKRGGRGIVREIARLLAYNSVITRGDVERISSGSSVGRQVLSYLKRSKLVFETESGYIISIPWLLYFYKTYKGSEEELINYIRRYVPIIKEHEVEELKKIIKEVASSPLEKFVEAYISSMENLCRIAQIPAKLLPKICRDTPRKYLELTMLSKKERKQKIRDLLERASKEELTEFIDGAIESIKNAGECVKHFLEYSSWLLTLIMELLELSAKGAEYGEAVRWISDTSRYLSRSPSLSEDELKEYRESLDPFNKLVIETIEELRRYAIHLYEIYKGKKKTFFHDAVEWAVENYSKITKTGEERARYYARLFLQEIAKAVLSDMSTRIALGIPC